ncbi:hypothetical protein, partial [Romeriopsis navalis]|uniref:hypothetical protein n=1 Tax=Romeriopsis navalis TaxID=2992132 RepID=UPI0021F8E79E
YRHPAQFHVTVMKLQNGSCWSIFAWLASPKVGKSPKWLTFNMQGSGYALLNFSRDPGYNSGVIHRGYETGSLAPPRYKELRIPIQDIQQQ